MNRPQLDAHFQGVAPTLRGAPLTRRQFLGALFGYLAFLAISLSMLNVMGDLARPFFHRVLPAVAFTVGRVGFASLYFAGFAGLLCTTLLGIRFLSDNLLREMVEVKRLRRVDGDPDPTAKSDRT
jgi:hypothetical protein